MAFNTFLDGLLKISKEEFQEITPETNVLYIVEGDSDFALYLGKKALQGGSISLSPTTGVLKADVNAKTIAGIIAYGEKGADL